MENDKHTEVPDSMAALSRQELSRKVSSGATVLTLGAFFTRLLNVAVAIILARLLAPEDFGLMALALSIVVFTQSATTTGFDAALIQKKGYKDLLDTAWTLEILRYSFIAFFLYLLAPLFALVLEAPGTVPIIRLLAISLLFLGFQNIGVHLVRKELNFNKQAVFEFVPSVIYSLTAIVLAYGLRNVWALAYGLLARNVSLFCLSYIVHPFRPRLRLQMSSAKELIHFGKWVFGIGIINMFRQQGTIMFIGKFFGTVVLGIYDRGMAFSALIFRQTTTIMWRIGFPLFSHIQDEDDYLRSIFTKAFHFACLISFPMAAGLFGLAEEFTLVLLTEKWIGIVPYIQIMSFYGLVGVVSAQCGILFQSKGVPHLSAKISAVELTIFVLLLPFSLIIGPLFVPAAMLFTTLFFAPVRFHYALKLLGLNPGGFFKYLLAPMVNSAVMLLCLFLWKWASLLKTDLVSLFLLIFLGAIVYTIMTVATDFVFKLNSCSLFMDRFKALLPIAQRS